MTGAMGPSRRILVAVLAALAALPVAGCGGEEADGAGRVEARAVEVDGLVYRATMARQLNPLIVPDRDFFDGPRAGPGNLWFAAFVHVCNRSDRTQHIPNGFRLSDAFAETHEMREGVVADQFDVEPRTLAPGECRPTVGGVAEEALPGAVLAFEIPERMLDDRPLFLVVPRDVADGADAVRIRLDV